MIIESIEIVLSCKVNSWSIFKFFAEYDDTVVESDEPIARKSSPPPQPSSLDPKNEAGYDLFPAVLCEVKEELEEVPYFTNEFI